METTSINIDAVLDPDLEPLLEKLQILNQINAQQVMCGKCDKLITLANIGAIGIHDGQVVVYCDDLGCIGEEDLV